MRLGVDTGIDLSGEETGVGALLISLNNLQMVIKLTQLQLQLPHNIYMK